MTLDVQNVGYISGVIGIVGTVFGVYRYFKNPQIDMDKRQALAEKESTNKMILLSQQLQWEKESIERRFSEMAARIAESTAMAQNHIHTIDTKVEVLTNSVNAMNIQLGGEIIKLGTILEERLPSNK